MDWRGIEKAEWTRIWEQAGREDGEVMLQLQGQPKERVV